MSKTPDYLQTEIPERATAQFDYTVANILADPAKATITLVFDIDNGIRQWEEPCGKDMTITRERKEGDTADKFVDRAKEREAGKVVNSIKSSMTTLLQRWNILKAPVQFNEPIRSAEGDTIVLQFPVTATNPDKFADTYDKLREAIRKSKGFKGGSEADPFVSQSRTKARLATQDRVETTEFTLAADVRATNDDAPQAANEDEPQITTDNPADSAPPVSDHRERLRKAFRGGGGYAPEWD